MNMNEKLSLSFVWFEKTINNKHRYLLKLMR